MINRYVVWTTHTPEDAEPFDYAEVSRTDRKVAEDDVGIFLSILHRRKAWIQETT